MQKTILLVEDNAGDEKLALLAFKRSGLTNEVLVVRDGAEALAFLHGTEERERRPLPALVLLDLHLPRIDGLEVLRRVRGDARTKALPVVIFTSSLQDEDVIRSYSLGANAYVRKPVDFGELVTALRTMGVFWLILNELGPEGSGAP
jgi:two-component system response regulator